jgi:hypothetical protein
MPRRQPPADRQSPPIPSIALGPPFGARRPLLRRSHHPLPRSLPPLATAAGAPHPKGIPDPTNPSGRSTAPPPNPCELHLPRAHLNCHSLHSMCVAPLASGPPGLRTSCIRTPLPSRPALLFGHRPLSARPRLQRRFTIGCRARAILVRPR